jgi:hypothetical protein
MTVLAIALAAIPVQAQSGRATIRGYIEFDDVGRNNVKAQGVVARVEMIRMNDGLEVSPAVTNTDDIGAYMLEQLQAGDYVLRISSPGFRTYEIALYLPSDFECKIATHLKKE